MGEIVQLSRHIFKTYSRIITSVSVCRRFMSVLAQKLVFRQFGEPLKVLKMEEEKLDEPKANEVLVRMLAAPVNPADINTIQGVYGIKPKVPAVPGLEGVGEIEKVGSEVKTLAKGDWVIPEAELIGFWRTHGIFKSSDLMKIPKKIGVVHAATLLINPCTAYLMLKIFVDLKPGDSVIQNGANSAVGQNVIQMCNNWGIKTVNVIRRKKDDSVEKYLKKLGATHVVYDDELRNTEIFKEGGIPKPNLGLNCVGGKNAFNMLRHLAKRGVFVTFGGMSKEPVTIPTTVFIFRDIRAVGFWLTEWTGKQVNHAKRHEMMKNIYQMMEDGKLKEPLHQILPFKDYEVAVKNTMSPQGSAGYKFILGF